jgi:glycosyltransferase involved in cell wall biosynthesis
VRVLYVNPAAELGGSERSLFDLLASLESTPEVVKKLLLFGDGELARRVRGLGVDVEILPTPRELSALGESDAGAFLARGAAMSRAAVSLVPYLRRFRRSVRTFRPSVIHTNGMKAHVLGALAAPDLPRVVHLRDFVSERPVSRHLLPLLGRNALFVTNSRAVESDALGVSPSLRTRVVYNGIDLEEFRPGPRELGHLATLSGLPPPPADSVVLGLVATYAWWKGHRTFIEAAARVRDELRGRALRFYVVGGPVYRTQGSQLDEAAIRREIELRGLASDVGVVPFQHDVARVYRGLDVLVHASERREPFGRTIVEAMASGRPVVVARAGGALELFDEGRTGLGFRPGDVADLSRALGALVADENLRRTLAEQGRRAAEERFGRSRLAREIGDAYRALLERDGGAR